MRARDGRSLRRGVHLALFLSLAQLAGCTPRATFSGPVVSPTGIVYELGTRPTETRFSQTAALYLRQDNVERALELALEGIEADPGNPIHYFLAGTAYARLGRQIEADPMFREAQRIYPAYELDIEPERERAWAEAFNEGIEAFDSEDVSGAIEAWSRAVAIDDLRPEAHRNLAVLVAGEGQYQEAIDVYEKALAGLRREPATRVLSDNERAERAAMRLSIEETLAQLLLFAGQFAEAEPLFRAQLERDPDNLDLQRDLARVLTGMGRNGEATVIYTSLISSGTLEATELFNVGVALFRSGDYAEAGVAFERLIELQPNSRDAWFNYANSLFAAEEWSSLAAAGERLLQLDPLSEDAGLIAARAHLEMGDEAAAREGLEETEGAPIYVEALRIRPVGGETVLEAVVVGNTAEEGATVRLRFTFYDDEGMLGSEMVSLAAPPVGESDTLEVSFTGRASAYRYEVVR